jgi:hypothetical protein
MMVRGSIWSARMTTRAEGYCAFNCWVVSAYSSEERLSQIRKSSGAFPVEAPFALSPISSDSTNLVLARIWPIPLRSSVFWQIRAVETCGKRSRAMGADCSL